MDVLDLEQVGPDTFTGSQPPWSSLRFVFGGQIAGQLLMAGMQTVTSERPVHAIHATFVESGDTRAPIRYHVERLREGGAFSYRRVTATQGDRHVAFATVSFHVPEAGLTHQVPMPQVRLPEAYPPLFAIACERSTIPAADWRREFGAFDFRHVDEHLTLDGQKRRAGAGLQRLWFRTREQLPQTYGLDAAVLAYISDFSLLSASLTPHGFLLGSPDIRRATLSHSVWFHAPVRPDTWLLYDQESPWAGQGRGLSYAHIFQADGTLVASAAQEGLIRPLGTVRDNLGLD